MAHLPAHLQTASHAPARAGSIVAGEHYRFTVLTPRLFRLEWSPSGEFTDNATQMVVNRDFATPDFTLTRDGDAVQIRTEYAQLNFTGAGFTPDALTVKYHRSASDAVWRPGHEPGAPEADLGFIRTQLGGTVRTVDSLDGAKPLEPGIMNSVGVASLADTGMLLTGDGWVAPRRAGNLDLYVFAYGRDYPAALADYYRLTGPQPMLPRYALGNWWSRYHRYSQAEYQGLIERFEAERLPFSVAVIDMDWHLVDLEPQYGSGWTGYTWNRELFPDHVAFLAWLHEHGLKVSLNVHPAEGVRAHEDAYPRLARAMGIDPETELPVNFDIANEAFLRHYLTEVHHPMEEEGVDFWWLDWQQGEFSSVPGLDPLWMLNHFHFLDSAREGRRPLTFSRYAGPGSHRYPVGFSGDSVISWESLAFQPYLTATAANIGYGWWSHDVGGHYFGYRDDALATRWVQFGVFSPITRLHSSNNPFSGKEPWLFDAIARDVMGDFLRLRHALVPYLYTMNERGHRELTTLIRPMYYSDPAVEAAYRVDNQYWFGDLIVAAITSPDDPDLRMGAVQAWLPAGEWIDWFTGLVYRGDKAVTLHRSLYHYPVLARAGAIVPLCADDDLRTDHPERLDVRLFTGADGEFTLYEDDDEVAPRAVRTRFRYAEDAATFTIDAARGELDVVPSTRHYRLIVAGAEPVGVRRDGRPCPSEYDAATGVLTVDVGPVATADGATLTFDHPPRRHDNQLAPRVRELLNRAQIAYVAKERAQALVEAGSSVARTIAGLAELGLPAPVEAAIGELLTAAE